MDLAVTDKKVPGYIGFDDNTLKRKKLFYIVPLLLSLSWGFVWGGPDSKAAAFITFIQAQAADG